jgi:diacylglycerol kinase
MFKRHVFYPLKYSLSGLKFSFRDRAFRFEIILGLIFYPLLILIFHFSWRLLFISIGYLTILIVETINCAIEKVVDLISPDIHPLAKQAKDIASAAVLLTLLNFALILSYCLFN